MSNKNTFCLWEDAKPLIRQGYRVLDKKVVLAVPAVSFPAGEQEVDIGIGSPYGDSAREFTNFFYGVADDFLLTPIGETFPPEFSPYTSTLGYNPHLIPPEKLPFITETDLEELRGEACGGTNINYEKVNELSTGILNKTFKKFKAKLEKEDKNAVKMNKEFLLFIKNNKYAVIDAKYYHKDNQEYNLFVQFIASAIFQNSRYIGDIPVKIPNSYVKAFPKAFLDEVTLGVPPDMFVDTPQNWGFPVLNPDKMFGEKGGLGEAGQLYFDIFDSAFKNNRAGLRIDHFIGVVNPFVIPKNKNYKPGRLYSSPENPLLARFYKDSLDWFAEITERVILEAAKKNGVSKDKIYAEDIGSRPPQIDYVMQKTGLGRMLVSQFVEPQNKNHIYRLKNAKPEDIAVLDTHDTESVQDFFNKMSETDRVKHSYQLVEDLRFNYAPDLVLPKNLMRMKWGELMASPAKRVMMFFTSFIGQEGRFNEPKNDVKWLLRCRSDYKNKYFSMLKQGLAYNPFDAVCLGIWARGDDFFSTNRKLVDELRMVESHLIASIDS